MRKTEISVATFIIAIIVCICGYAVYSMASIPDSEVIRVVENAGYKNPVVTDRKYFLKLQCDKGDAVQFEVTATSPATDEEIDIYVCKGLFKAYTIRME